MSAIKGQPLPAILFANDLLEGDVIFLGPSGWTRNPAEAAIARTQDEADALQATGAAAAARNEVVDVYLAEVSLDPAGRPTLPVPIAFSDPELDSGTQFDLVPDVEPQFMRVHVSGNDLGTYAVSVSDFYCFGWVWPVYDGFWAC